MTSVINALVGLKITYQILKFPDKDLRFKKHWRDFKFALDMNSYGRTGIRPIDMLICYKDALSPGGVRAMTYDTLVDKANRYGRLPDQAMEVLEEIKQGMKDDVKETMLNAQTRLENEYDQLQLEKLKLSSGLNLKLRLRKWMSTILCPTQRGYAGIT